MVIRSISFENFYSFKKRVKMDFLVNQNAPSIDHFAYFSEKKTGNHFSKISAIYGANASGKTNLILGFEFLQEFIAHSFSYSRDGFFKYYPFHTLRKKASTFEVEFYIEGLFYKLYLKINRQRVLSEVLKSQINNRWVELYSRKYDRSNKIYSFASAKSINLESNFIEKVRPNASIISTARQYNHPELTKIRNHWATIFKKYRKTSMFEDEFDFFDFHSVSKFYHENKAYFLQAKKFLQKADLGLSGIEIERTEREDSRGKSLLHFFPHGIHKNSGEEFKLPFSLESGGTQYLYRMLSFIFPALKKGTVCLIDEIENNLHPNILSSIIDLFVSPESNPHKAQLIFTTHLPTLMNELSKYQIFLVEKTPECESEVHRLDEVEGVRNDDNLQKKYLAGAYGGVPDTEL